jgi:heme oxygenase
MKNKRPNNGKLKIKEIRDLIRKKEYKIHEHFEKRFNERDVTERDIHRIIFDGEPQFQFNSRVAFKWKKNCVVVEFKDKENGKILDITLLTIY